MGREFELKFAAQPQILAQLYRDYPGAWSTTEMETTYYDTFDARLSNYRWTLRRRLENGKSICTLKTPGENGGRGEWEVECKNILSAIPMLCKLGAPQELMIFSISGLQSICGAKFTRKALMLETDGGAVELALDEGVLMGGGREKPLCEVEVELKKGDDRVALEFAEKLAQTYHLTVERQSKHRRAIGLLFGE